MGKCVARLFAVSCMLQCVTVCYSVQESCSKANDGLCSHTKKTKTHSYRHIYVNECIRIGRVSSCGEHCVCVCLYMLSCFCWCRLSLVIACCSVFQCVTVCCIVLYCVAVCCSVLQCVVLCCSMLQCAASCWRRLPLVIARCCCGNKS